MKVADAKPPARFTSFLKKAQELVESNTKLTALVGRAVRKLATLSGDGAQKLREQVGLSIALIKAWISGEYREVSTSTIVSVVAALLYFVVPLDVVPDFVFGWGLLDDAAVLAYVVNQLHTELEAFRQFQVDRGNRDAGSPEASSSQETQQHED